VREVVGEEHRVGQVRQAEARVRRRHLLVRDDRGDGVHARAAEALLHRDAQKPQRPELSKQRDVEALLAVMRRRLGLDLAQREAPHHLAQRAVLVGGVEQVGHRLSTGRRRGRD
jgi:hypothetical protein